MSVHPLPFILTEGKEITIQGVTSHDGGRFSINLCSGQDHTSDTALHFNPRFEQSEVVRNHFDGDGWGDEETEGGFPFSKGESYEVKIVLKAPCFQIFVNRSYFCDFNHRMPMGVIKNVSVEGDTTATNVTFKDWNQNVDGVYPLPFVRTEGKVIQVEGVTYPESERFSINLCSGQDHTSNTALHFNPRFDQSEVVRNHFDDGNWGNEETHGGFPFSQGKRYTLKIVTQEAKFQIFVDGSHFCDFEHRHPKEIVRNVFVDGDTKVNSVTFPDWHLSEMGIHPVPFELNEGKEIIVQGVANSDCNRFSINLCSGNDLETDTALHFNPRFDQSEVVRNHFKGGWGEEETHGGFPFSRGEYFNVKIIVQEQCLQINVNENHFCDFKHRLPIQSVRNVYIKGDTTVFSVVLNNNSSILNPPVPFTTQLKSGCYPGRKVVISGKPYAKPSRFSVNLMTDDNFENSDIALHFDARFDYGSSQNVVVRNYRMGGDYGEEETGETYFPFAPDAPFDMVIFVQPEVYQIEINNQYHSSFKHRLTPIQAVQYLNVHGDVDLWHVRFD